MKNFISLLILLCCGISAFAQVDQLSFKDQQLEYTNVKMAYVDQGKILEEILAKKKVYTLGNYLLIRVFKQEGEVEVWFRHLAAGKYQLLETMKLCSNSGDVGPKKYAGDQKIPEGFYEINRFAPDDPYLLALGLDYPNQADRYRNSPASNIEFRGGCKSSGSMPLGNEGMQKLYILALEAYAVGQTPIPVHIFPTRMEGERFNKLIANYSDRAELVRFWHNIKTGYDYFNLTKRLPVIETGIAGSYYFKDGGVEIVGTTSPVVVGSLNPDDGAGNLQQPPANNLGNAGAAMPTPPANTGEYHVVKANETLYGISRQYQRSIYVLKKWNNIQGNIISPGQRLRIVPPNYYVVKPGDTLYGIARKYGLKVEALKRMNGLQDNILKIGDNLVVAP